MAPILFPMAAALGVHPVHLGILMAVNMEVGLCHPPVGLNLYVAAGITKMGIGELTIAVLPWLATMLVFLVMVTYIPEISLWLPRAARHAGLGTPKYRIGIAPCASCPRTRTTVVLTDSACARRSRSRGPLWVESHLSPSMSRTCSSPRGSTLRARGCGKSICGGGVASVCWQRF